MLVTRWQPLVELQNEMNRLRDEVWGRVSEPSRLWFGGEIYPPLDLWEDDENFYVEAELPGLALSDLEISLSAGNQLLLKGQRKQPETEKGTWHRRERGFGEFSRTVELPGDVDPEKTEAEFKDGVLVIRLAKQEQFKARKIEVKSE